MLIKFRRLWKVIKSWEAARAQQVTVRRGETKQWSGAEVEAGRPGASVTG